MYLRLSCLETMTRLLKAIRPRFTVALGYNRNLYKSLGMSFLRSLIIALVSENEKLTARGAEA